MSLPIKQEVYLGSIDTSLNYDPILARKQSVLVHLRSSVYLSNAADGLNENKLNIIKSRTCGEMPGKEICVIFTGKFCNMA